MDDRSDFGSLEHARLASAAAAAGGLYRPSAAVAVNSGLMQLPSLGDTAGRGLSVMDRCPSLPPAFGCPPGLHPDYSAMNALAQLHGWYRPAVPNQNSTFPDLFGAYVGPGGNWRNLSTPPTVSDHFHSPLPGMTHPVWPCPPTPVACTEGCSLSYYNSANMYSAAAYSAYISLMSNSTASDYPPYLSPGFPGSMPPYQQRLHDRNKAFPLANSSGGHRSPEFLSPWHPYLTGSASVAGPLHSPGCHGASGQMAFGFGVDETFSSNKGIRNEQKQNIKQEPMSGKMKVKDGDHKPRDNSKRDLNQLWGHSAVSNSELLPETKPGFTSRKFPKDEKLHSPTANTCSLDLRSNNNNASITNNNNNNNLNSNATNETSQLSSNEPADDVLSAESGGERTILLDQKPCLRNRQSSEVKETNLNESTKQWSTDSCCQEMSIRCHSVVNKLATESSPLLTDGELSEGRRSHDVLLAVSSVASGVTPDADCFKESICQTGKDEVLSSLDTSSASALTGNSKSESELKKSPDITDSTKVSKENDVPQLVTSNELNSHSLLDDPNMAVESSEKNTCIMQHSLFFEEISNDGMESNEKDTEDQAEVHDVETSNSVLSACWAASFPAMSSKRDGSQKNSFIKIVQSDSTAFPLASSSCTATVRSSSEMPVMFLSSAPESSVAVSLCSVLTAPLLSASLSTRHAATTDFSSMLKTSTAAKSDASGAFSHSVALTLYKDGSVKLPPTLVSDGMSSLSSQEIDLPMPRQSMRYQVSRHRQNPMQDGCKVHAPTFLPEVCTLPCNTITTITMSSSVSPGLHRSVPSAKIGSGIVSSKLVAGHRVGRTQTKLRSSSLNTAASNTAEALVKMEKCQKFSPDFVSAAEIKDAAVTSGKSLISNDEVIQAAGNCREKPFASEKSPVNATSGHPFVRMEPWSQSFVGGPFSSILPSNCYLFQSSASNADSGCHRSKFFSPLFTVAELNTITSVTPALGKSTAGEGLEVTMSPVASKSKYCDERNQNAEIIQPGDRVGNSGGVTNMDFDGLLNFENLCDVLVRGAPIDQTFPRSVLQRKEGASGIPIGIARALQRTNPQPASACSASGGLIDGQASTVSAERPKTADSKSETSSFSSNLSSVVGSKEKAGLLSVQSSASATTETADKQPCLKNDSELRPHIFSSSLNRAWFQGVPPTTLAAASVNPAAVVIRPFSPFHHHHHALLPYASTSVDLNQSRHLFHPASGYKLAQDSMTGQFFFIPVPDVSWPNLGNCMYPDPSAQHMGHDKEQSSVMENTSPATNSSKLEVRADASVYNETVQVSSEAALLQPTDLSIGSLQLKKDNRSLSEGVDVGHIPIIFPTTRPPYFFCDSQLFIQDPQRQKERTRVCVESRGTSPIQCLLDVESKDEAGHGDQQALKDAESKRVKVEPEKVTLNAAVQTNESLSLTTSVEKACTAEISIQTSDVSDAESFSSDSSVGDNRKNFELRKETTSCDLKLSDAAICRCKENSVKYCSSIKQESLLMPAVKDVALAEIVSDQLDCKSKPNSSCQNCLPEIPRQTNVLDEKEMSEIDKTQPNIIIDSCDKSDILLKPVSQKSLDNIMRMCTGDRNLSQTHSTRFVDLVEAVNAELSNCTEVQKSSFKSGLNADLDDLVMLSNIASTQLPATPGIILLKQETREEGGCSAGSGRRFNVGLDISQFVECEHSPDVSTSYNVPKSCFFSETEFPSNSKGYLQHSNSDELKEDDLMSGILKPDKGPENMDPMELDLRMKMAEVQLKYKQKQKELARIQRKNNELRSNSNSKRKKLKPVSKPGVQRKRSISKQLCILSDDSSDSSTDTEESDQESVKKNLDSKTSIKSATTAAVRSEDFTHRFSGIKIKVSNPQKKATVLSSTTSTQFQRSLKSPSKKEHRHSSDLWKKESYQSKPHLTSDKQDKSKLPTSRVRSFSSCTAEECLSGLEMKKRKPEQPKKLNIVTEDVMLKKKPKQFCFYSYKKKSSANSKEIKKHRLQITDAKSTMKDKLASKVETGRRKTVDDEWYRRRSERIFLHEASAGPLSSPTAPIMSQMNFGDEKTLSVFQSKAAMKPTRTLSQESGLKAFSTCQKSELSVTLKTCLLSSIQASVSKKQMTSDSSDTDTDDVPLSSLVHKEPSLELRSCSIGKADLADDLRVLYLKDGLFYEGTVKAVLPPDVYRVNIDGERSSRQEVLSQEELLQKAILNVKPTSKVQLPEGSRICAYWSQKFSCLYPGTVRSLGEGSDYDGDADENTVHIEFDDGDNGTIPLTHISMLPPGYKIQESETSSTVLLGHRKRRSTADEPVGLDVLQRPSTISRSISPMDSASGCVIADHRNLDSSVGMKQNSVRRTSSGERSGTNASSSAEKKPKNEKQEYSCRLKTESGCNRLSADFGLESFGKKYNQKKGDGIDSGENDNFEMSNFTANDQKKSNLTLTIKRKPSCEKDTSSSSTDDDDDMTSDEDDVLKSHKRHLKHKKMKLEEMDHTSVSDANETSAIETLRSKGQRRKRQSSHKSTKSRRRHQSSSESGDQIGAFRPVWEQWQWHGPCTRRPGMKGKAKKQFYRAIQRESEVLKIGDAAVFVSMGHNDLQYVGCIDSLWESWDGNMVVKVKWYYHPEETKGGKRLLEIKSALYQSSHEDENDVQTVSHKCEVLSYTNFKKFQAKKYPVNCKPEDVFYLAGSYDPTISMITYEPDVPLKSH